MLWYMDTASLGKDCTALTYKWQEVQEEWPKQEKVCQYAGTVAAMFREPQRYTVSLERRGWCGPEMGQFSMQGGEGAGHQLVIKMGTSGFRSGSGRDAMIK